MFLDDFCLLDGSGIGEVLIAGILPDARWTQGEDKGGRCHGVSVIVST